MAQWLAAHETLLEYLVAFSLASFIGTLIAVPVIVVALPSTYFARRKRSPAPWPGLRPVLRLPLLIAKNAAAVTLIALGIAMLVLPGQGILTIVVGLLLLDFPGKFRAERWLVSRHWILSALNRIRTKAGKAPFVVGEATRREHR